MAHSLSRILKDEIAKRFSLFGINTALDLLTVSPLQIMSILDIGLDETNRLLRTVGEKVSPSSSTAFNILQTRGGINSFLSTGIKELDKIMYGGFPIGMLTEVTGSPGSGKTHIYLGCLADLSIHTSFRTIVFDTELKFNIDRLIEVIRSRCDSSSDDDMRGSPVVDIDAVLSRILIKRPLTCKALFEDIESLEALVISEGIKVIVIDSIAVLARKEGLVETEKETFLVRQANTLKLIAELCQCVVIITNQVSSTSSTNDGPPSTSSSYVVNPSLGPIWDHCVSTRLTIQKLDEFNLSQGSTSQSQYEVGNVLTETERLIKVAKSPMLSSSRLRCAIKKSGLVAVATS